MIWWSMAWAAPTMSFLPMTPLDTYRVHDGAAERVGDSAVGTTSFWVSLRKGEVQRNGERLDTPRWLYNGGRLFMLDPDWIVLAAPRANLLIGAQGPGIPISTPLDQVRASCGPRLFDPDGDVYTRKGTRFEVEEQVLQPWVEASCDGGVLTTWKASPTGRYCWEGQRMSPDGSVEPWSVCEAELTRGTVKIRHANGNGYAAILPFRNGWPEARLETLGAPRSIELLDQEGTLVWLEGRRILSLRDTDVVTLATHKTVKARPEPEFEGLYRRHGKQNPWVNLLDGTVKDKPTKVVQHWDRVHVEAEDWQAEGFSFAGQSVAETWTVTKAGKAVDCVPGSAYHKDLGPRCVTDVSQGPFSVATPLAPRYRAWVYDPCRGEVVLDWARDEPARVTVPSASWASKPFGRGLVRVVGMPDGDFEIEVEGDETWRTRTHESPYRVRRCGKSP